MELDKKNYRQNDNKFRYFNRLAPWRVLGIDKKNYRQNDNKFRYFNRLAPWRVLGIDKCGF